MVGSGTIPVIDGNLLIDILENRVDDQFSVWHLKACFLFIRILDGDCSFFHFPAGKFFSCSGLIGNESYRFCLLYTSPSPRDTT